MTESVRSDADLLNSATGAGLLYFCDLMIKRSEMTKATGSALRTGSKKVLETEEDYANVDLRSLDVDGLLRRFTNKNRVELNDRSLQVYQQRFRQTLDMYLKYIDGDPNWNSGKGRSAPTRPAASKAAKGSKAATVVEMPNALSQDTANLDTPTPPPPAMIEYPIPLRPGIKGMLTVPEDMTHREAQKVVKVVTALAQAFEEQLALPPGTSDS